MTHQPKENDTIEMTKNFRAIWRSIRWALSILFGLVILLIRRPQSALAIPKLVVSKLHKVPERVRHESHLSSVEITMAQHLSECALNYMEMKPGDNGDNLKWLKTMHHLGKDRRWGLLYLLIRRLKPSSVVETGVGEGKSTSYILQGLTDNSEGLLTSIDLPNRFYIRDDRRLQADFLPFREQPGRLVPNHLRNRWKLIIGSSKNKLPSLLNSLGKVDLFFHDSEHTYEMMSFEFACAWEYLNPCGYLVADDVVINSAFSDFAKLLGLEPAIIGGLGFLQKP